MSDEHVRGTRTDRGKSQATKPHPAPEQSWQAEPVPVKSFALSPAVADTPSVAVQTVIDSIVLEAGALAKTISPAGGVQVGALREVIKPVATKFELTLVS